MCVCVTAFLGLRGGISAFAFHLASPMALFMDQSSDEKRMNNVFGHKKYIAIVFSVFSKISYIQTDPK